MENRINEILESNISDGRKVGVLHRLGREAFDRGLIELFGEYLAASDSFLRDGKPYAHQRPFSQKVFYAQIPQVIILKEKHGDWVYDASTPENAARACLATIKRRLNDGYWYSDELEEEDDDNPVGQFDMFRPNTIPLTEVEQVEKILEIGRESDGLIVGGKQAFDFLLSRDNHQYEDIEVQAAEIAEFE